VTSRHFTLPYPLRHTSSNQPGIPLLLRVWRHLWTPPRPTVKQFTQWLAITLFFIAQIIQIIFTFWSDLAQLDSCDPLWPRLWRHPHLLWAGPWPTNDVTSPVLAYGLYNLWYSPARPAHLLICCLLAVGARRCWRVSRVCRFNGRSLKAVTVRHRCRKQTSFDRTTKRPRNSFAVRTYGRSEADRWSHSSRRVGCFTVLCAVWTVATRYGLGITRQVFRHGKLCR